MGQFGIGQSVKRFEDVRLLRGEGRFHHDVNLPGQAHMVVVRSTHAHARIRSIETAAAAVAKAASVAALSPTSKRFETLSGHSSHTGAPPMASTVQVTEGSGW